MDDLHERLRTQRARCAVLRKQGVRLRLQASLVVVRSQDLLLVTQVERHLRQSAPDPASRYSWR